jgi:predicted phosphodiesterase
MGGQYIHRRCFHRELNVYMGQSILRRKQLLRNLVLLSALLVLIASAGLCYSIKNPEGDISSLVRNEETGEGFTFAVLGDSRSGIEMSERILEEIRKGPAAFAINLGDFVPHNTEVDYKFFVDLTKKETEGQYPLFMVVGNHDIKAQQDVKSPDRFERYFGRSYYWFTFKNALFIVLNNADGNIDDEQFAWFEHTLASQRAKFKLCFVFLHIPLFEYRANFDHAMNKKKAEQIVPLIEQYSVTAVFAGHIHTYHKEIRNGVLYIISGGAGARLHEDPAGAFHHFVVVNVGADRIATTVVPISATQSIEDKIEYVWEVRLPDYAPYLIVSVVTVLLAGAFALYWMKKRARFNVQRTQS